uniref:Uncharacterized protein n=1 Tax=Amphimedon queenslandica TaxID=400682 RepID=A0A1X7STR1_AMPQE
NWKCDQMKWRHNEKKELKTVPVITKTYYFLLVLTEKKTALRDWYIGFWVATTILL